MVFLFGSSFLPSQMVLGTLLYQKSYSLKSYVAVIMVCVGCAMFMLLKEGKAGDEGEESSLTGIGLVMVNLLLDGFTNSTQDEMGRRFNTSSFQVFPPPHVATPFFCNA